MRKIIILGYGTIGSCVLDVLLLDVSHLSKMGITYNEIIVVDKSFTNKNVPTNEKNTTVKDKNINVEKNKVNNILFSFFEISLKKENLKNVFDFLNILPFDIVIDLTSGTGTRDIVTVLAKHFKACYISTALEGWNGFLKEMPEEIRSTRTYLKKLLPKGSPTCLLTHGMNPGLVSHFALFALESFSKKDLQELEKLDITEIDNQWLSKKEPLKISVPHLVTTKSFMRKKILSTWGPQNFADEMNAVPVYVENGKTLKGTKRAVKTIASSFIKDPYKEKVVPYKGFVVTHEETFTLQEYFKEQKIAKNASISFVYTPTKLTLDSLTTDGERLSKGSRSGYIVKGSSLKGYDTVGVYIKSKSKAVWVGNSCSAGFAFDKKMKMKNHNATTMQVAAGVLSGLLTICKNQKMGFMYPEDVSKKSRHDLLQFITRYIGKIDLYQLE